MRRRLLYRYIFSELIPPFFINLAFLTFVFLMTQILDITHMIVNYRVRLWDVIRMLVYSMPYFLEFVIPMSVMMAVLLTFLRLSGDNEIIALKTGGTSLYALLPPVIAFCLAGALLTASMAVFGLPWGRVAFRQLACKLAETNIDVGIKERTFNDHFDGVMLYVNRVDFRNKRLVDVFIEDKRNADKVSTVVAPEGRIFSDPENMAYHLRLFNGTINQVDVAERSAHTIHFETYDVRLDMKRVFTGRRSGPKDEEEMSLAELRHTIDNARVRDDRYYLVLLEFHKKFSIPMACLALGILAVPLGVQSRTARKSFGVGLALVFFLLYYLLLSAGWVFGEAGLYPPLIGMWVPNLVMGGIGLVLLVRVANERTTVLDMLVPMAGRLLGRRFAGAGRRVVR